MVEIQILLLWKLWNDGCICNICYLFNFSVFTVFNHASTMSIKTPVETSCLCSFTNRGAATVKTDRMEQLHVDTTTTSTATFESSSHQVCHTPPSNQALRACQVASSLFDQTESCKRDLKLKIQKRDILNLTKEEKWKQREWKDSCTFWLRYVRLSHKKKYLSLNYSSCINGLMKEN